MDSEQSVEPSDQPVKASKKSTTKKDKEKSRERKDTPKKPRKESAPKKEKKIKTKREEKDEEREIEKGEPKKLCKRGFKFCRNPQCDEMVHIHKKSCPKCGFEFEMKVNLKEEPQDPAELEKLLNKKKKVKKEAAQEESEGLDMRVVKKAFYRVKTDLINK